MKHGVDTEGRLRLRLYGTVQGVGFRAFTRAAARRHGVHGYVLNRQDGAVELEAAGPDGALAAFRATVSQGPPYAAVQRVEELEPSARTLGTSFEIVRE